MLDTEAVTDFGVRGVYIGPACDSLCGGHGDCDILHYPACTCDEGYYDDNCYPWRVKNPVRAAAMLYARLLQLSKA